MSCETSSVWIKKAIFVLGLVCVFFIVGFATTSWAIDVTVSGSNERTTYSLGLWQECFCVETPLTNKYCRCGTPERLTGDSETAWFTVVQMVEAIGLVGLVFCEIITFVIICILPNQNLKILILIMLPFSCMCIIIGVIVFGIEKDKVYGVSGKLSYSLVLCAVAAGHGLLVCLPLFILDMRSMPDANLQTTDNYSDEEYIIPPTPSDAPMSNQYPTPGIMQLDMAYRHPSYSYPQEYEQQLAPYNAQFPQTSDDIQFQKY